MNPLSQRNIILSMLKSGRTVTPMDALNEASSLRLSARIFELKEDKWPIECERRDIGDGRVVGHYTLVNNKDLWPE